MTFHIRLPTLHKSKKQQKNHDAADDDTMSTASTIAPSKSRSVLDAFLNSFSTEKYMNDPMRTTNRPEVVGYYYDPMSCGPPSKPGYIVSSGYDCTNTGA
jgi:hypothetical protein